MSKTLGTHLMTRAEYKALSPMMQGYSYQWFHNIPGAKKWLTQCPYDSDRDTIDFSEFQRGRMNAIVEGAEE
jgi:hypothetical protein